MRTVEAQIKIEKAGFRHLTFAVLILAGLLSGFFWLGYWTAESKTVYSSTPMNIERANQPNAPGKNKVTPVEELNVDPKDLIRL